MPWPVPVYGAEILCAIESALRRFVFTSDAQRVVLAGYALYTHCFPAFDIAPKLFLSSAVPASGKSLLLDIMAEVVANPESSSNMTAADMLRVIAAESPTLLLDEIDHWLRGDRSDRMSILNGSHRRSKAYVHKVIGGMRTRFSIFCPMIIAALEEVDKPPPFPPSFETRCLKLTLRPPNAVERAGLEKFRAESGEMKVLHDMAERWGRDFTAALRASDPELPPGLDGRQEDNARPLLAIADLAGADWPVRMREAIVAIYATNDEVAPDNGTDLIRDVAIIIHQQRNDRIASADLTVALRGRDRRYRYITAYRLARMLGGFGISPKSIRIGNTTLRGYEAMQIDDAVERFRVDLAELPRSDDTPAPAAATTATTATKARNSSDDAFMTAPEVCEVIFKETLDALLEENLTPADELCWCEACAGSGNLLRLMPADRRIGFDIHPQDQGQLGIIQADYRTQRLDPNKRWIAETNPNFSGRGPQIYFQWAATQPCVYAIGIVAPHYFDRATIINKLDPSFHRVRRIELDPASFLHAGQRKWVPAVFSLWLRRSYRRDLILSQTEHPDWQWLPRSRMGEASAWIQNWGMGVGDLKRPDRLGRINDPANHLFLKEVKPGTINRLAALNLRDAGYPTLSTPRITKDQIVAAYTATYGGMSASGEPVKVAEVIGEATDRLVICGSYAMGWQVRRIGRAALATLRQEQTKGVKPGLNVGLPASLVWPTRAEAEVAAKRQAKRLGVPWDATE